MTYCVPGTWWRREHGVSMKASARRPGGCEAGMALQAGPELGLVWALPLAQLPVTKCRPRWEAAGPHASSFAGAILGGGGQPMALALPVAEGTCPAVPRRAQVAHHGSHYTVPGSCSREERGLAGAWREAAGAETEARPGQGYCSLH